MSTDELQALIDEWVELFIAQQVAFRTGQKATPERINELFNLLIAQGDDTAKTVAHIRDYLRQYKIERAEDDAALQAYMDSILAQVRADNAQAKQELNALKDTVTQYRDETVAILEPMFNEVGEIRDETVAAKESVDATKAEIDLQLSAAGTVITEASQVYEAIDRLRVQIDLMPIDGGTFFDTYPEWNVDGGTFDN